MADIEKVIKTLNEDLLPYLKDQRDIDDTRYSRFYELTVNSVQEAIDILEDKNKERKDFETAYMAGYQYGYQMAIKDMAKKLKGMKWYGGGNKTEHADGLPGV